MTTKTAKKVETRGRKKPIRVRTKTVTFSDRIERKGVKVKFRDFISTLDSRSRRNLDTLSSKFLITWKFALDNVKGRFKEDSSPSRGYLVVGKSKDGKDVYYDRRQSSIFIDNHKEIISRAVNMTPKTFETVFS